MCVDDFNLNNDKLQNIACALYEKILNGLKEENAEIRCIPTYIKPKISKLNGKALALDLGGTNFRVAVVELKEGKEPLIHPENGWHKELSAMRTENYTQKQLFEELANLISKVDEKELPVGYCFSYPAETMLNGDAKLIRWTKGITIDEMVGQLIGKPLLDYLNNRNKTHYTSIKVINDTVASLFAGMAHCGYDAYIGLIVGTGVNMATFFPAERIEKLSPEHEGKELIPINLESGNFSPPYLTDMDNAVDAETENEGQQRFEKAVSGFYLGKIFQKAFPNAAFEDNLDARNLTYMLNFPDTSQEKYVETARAIYIRSANLVAASLKGLIDVLIDFDREIKRICLTAEGSLFWSEDENGVNYEILVYNKLDELLKESGYEHVTVDIKCLRNANMIGSAIAALS